MAKFFGTVARTSLVDCVHGMGLVYSQKCALANQRCVYFYVYACIAGFEREVPKNCGRDCSGINRMHVVIGSKGGKVIDHKGCKEFK